jgi:hypothetical protein
MADHLERNASLIASPSLKSEPAAFAKTPKHRSQLLEFVRICNHLGGSKTWWRHLVLELADTASQARAYSEEAYQGRRYENFPAGMNAM